MSEENKKEWQQRTELLLGEEKMADGAADSPFAEQ